MEKKLEKFIKMAEMVGKVTERIYTHQVGDGLKAVYPKKVLEKLKIEEIPSELREQFSVLRVNDNGDLYNVKYSEAYELELREIRCIVQEYLNDPDAIQKGYLEKLIGVTRSNDWSELEREFLRHSEHEVLWNFGPIESMSDKVAGYHRYFSSLVVKRVDTGDLIEHIVQHAEQFVNSLPVNDFMKPAKVKVYVGETLDQQGEIGSLKPSGWSRPENLQLAEQEGTLKQLFVNTLDKKVQELYFPLVDMVYNAQEAVGVKNFMKENYYLIVTLHEISHTIGKFPGYRERLGSSYNAIEEIKTDFVSYLYAAALEDAGILPSGFLLNMLKVNHIVGTDMERIYLESGQREAYYLIFQQFKKLFGKCYDVKKKAFSPVHEEATLKLRQFIKKLLSDMSKKDEAHFRQVIDILKK